MLGLNEAPVRLEVLEHRAVDGILGVVLRELGLELLVRVGRLPRPRELLGRRGDRAVEVVALPSLGGRRETRQEVGRRLLPASERKRRRGAGAVSETTAASEVRWLSLGAVEAHVDEELLGLARRTEVDLLALVEDDDLVEDVVRGLRGLVDGDAGDRVVELDTSRR